MTPSCLVITRKFQLCNWTKANRRQVHSCDVSVLCLNVYEYLDTLQICTL